MQVQEISTSAYSQPRNQPTSFKSKYILDIGASDPRASLKIRVQTNKGKDLFEYKGFLNDTSSGFTSNSDFTSKVARAINVDELIDRDLKSLNTQISDSTLTDVARKKLHGKIEELHSQKQILQARTAAEKKLTGVSLLLPGTLQQHTALFMANLKKTDGTSLDEVNLDNIISGVKTQGNVQIHSGFDIAKDFIPTKDLAGTGIGIAQKLVQDPVHGASVGKGYHAVATQTGGGFGAADIEFQSDKTVLIRTNESGHDLYLDPDTHQEVRLGKLGASTSCVIENYAKTLGITDAAELKALVKAGKAEISTQMQVKFNTTEHKEAIDALLKTGAYEIAGQNADSTILKVKDGAKFAEASKYAIKRYAYAISRHAITKIDQGANLYVLSGPLAMGLNDRVKEAPEVFGNGVKDMRDLIFQLIDERVGNDFTCNKLREKNHFDIVCDRSMSIENNTSGGALFLAKRLKEVARRGEWITVDKDVLMGKVSSAMQKAAKEAAKLLVRA